MNHFVRQLYIQYFNSLKYKHIIFRPIDGNSVAVGPNWYISLGPKGQWQGGFLREPL